MRTIILFAMVVTTLGLGSLAEAESFGRPCTSAPQSQWQSVGDQRNVEVLGSEVQKNTINNASSEVYATDKNGGRIELFVDPTNGAIIGRS